MRHGGFKLFEPMSIAQYIDTAFDGPKMFGTDPKVADEVT